MSRIRGLAFVGVESPAYKQWETIGPAVFSMQIGKPGADGAIRLRIDDYDYRIAIHPGEADRLRYLSWEVDTESDLEEARWAIDEAGLEWVYGSAEECEERGVAGMVVISSPSAIRHELVYGARQLFRSFSPPRRFAGFVTGDQGLGHVVVYASDLESEERFLQDALGFRLTDIVRTPSSDVHFFHTNARHHSIACIATDGESRLHHLMVQACELDDVGIALDIVQARDDLSLTKTLGRHATDQMVSFYVRTPSGFELEYGWGAIQLTDSWLPTTSVFPDDIWGHQALH